MTNQPQSQDALKAGVLGYLGAAALGAVMMAPALGIYANLGLISAASGKVGPFVFLLALACTLPTAISYALIAREIPSAGSAYTWLSQAISPFVGFWMGLLLLQTYLFCVVLQPIVFGVFFNDLVSSLFHVQIGFGTTMLGIVVSSIIVASLTYPGVQISGKASLVVTIIEVLVVLALSCTIFAGLTAHGQLQLAPILPGQSLHGIRGLSQGLVFGLLSFVGFGVITTAAEETQSPRSVIPRVVVIACVFLGIYWALTAWSFCAAFPAEAWARYVSAGRNPVAVMARQYWRAGSIIVTLTAITAALGVYLASVIGYSRVAFAMGRDGTLPGLFGRLHPRYKIPWLAQHIAFLLALGVGAVWCRWLGVYMAYDWWGTVVVFFAMISNIFVNIGCAVFFYRFRRELFSAFWHLLLPILGIATSLLPLYYSFGPNLWRQGWEKGQSIVLFSVLMMALATGYTVIWAALRPEALRTTP